MPEPSDPNFPEIPDFSRWDASRLKVLLEDYQEAVQSIRLLYGNHRDAQLYKAWIKAIEEELHRRTE